MAIVDSLAYQEVQKRVEDRLAKAQKKIEKDIAELEGHKPMRRKDKRKSRLDTGLTSYRVLHSLPRLTARTPTEYL